MIHLNPYFIMTPLYSLYSSEALRWAPLTGEHNSSHWKPCKDQWWCHYPDLLIGSQKKRNQTCFWIRYWDVMKLTRMLWSVLLQAVVTVEMCLRCVTYAWIWITWSSVRCESTAFRTFSTWLKQSRVWRATDPFTSCWVHGTRAICPAHNTTSSSWNTHIYTHHVQHSSAIFSISPLSPRSDRYSLAARSLKVFLVKQTLQSSFE